MNATEGSTAAYVAVCADVPEPSRLEALEFEPWFITNNQAMRLLGIRVSTYWRLVRERRIITVGKGRASRASFKSIKAYAERRLAEAEAKIGTGEAA
jgi:hypothetical protein